MLLSRFFCFWPDFTGWAQVSDAAPSHAKILPATPDIILPCLPKPPQNWKLTQSKGYSLLSSGWLATYVVRRYLEVPPPPPPGKAAKVPGETKIVVIDTGYLPELESGYMDSTTSPSSGEEEKGEISGFPTITDKPASPDDPVSMKILVKQRFLVRMTATHQDEDALKQWANGFDFDALTKITDDGPNQLVFPLTISQVDELNPAGTHKYVLPKTATPAAPAERPASPPSQ